MKPHASFGCHKEKLHELAVFADNEYYIASVTADQQRKQRGLSRIQAVILELENLKGLQTCQACLEEISCQLLLQGKALKDLLSRSKAFLDTTIAREDL